MSSVQAAKYCPCTLCLTFLSFLFASQISGGVDDDDDYDDRCDDDDCVKNDYSYLHYFIIVIVVGVCLDVALCTMKTDKNGEGKNQVHPQTTPAPTPPENNP
jgi:hypothetical protein